MLESRLSPHQFNPKILFITRRVATHKDVVPSHAHDFTSLIYIVEGEGSYEFNGRIVPVQKGSLFVCDPGMTHHRVLAPGQTLEIFHVGISNLGIRGLPDNCLLPPAGEPAFDLGEYAGNFSGCVHEIIQEQKLNDAGSPLLLKCLVMKLIAIILKARYAHSEGIVLPVTQHDAHDKAAIVENVAAWLEQNYMKTVTLASLSETAYLSPIYISRIFKEITGESPIQYLIRIRMNKASQLLKDSSDPISEVARKVGYPDAFYFSRLFKKHFGLSPNDYRRHGQT